MPLEAITENVPLEAYIQSSRSCESDVLHNPEIAVALVLIKIPRMSLPSATHGPVREQSL